MEMTTQAPPIRVSLGALGREEDAMETTTRPLPNREQAMVTTQAPPICVSLGALGGLPDKIYSLLSSEKAAGKRRLHKRDRNKIVDLHKACIELWKLICLKVQSSSSEVEAADESWMGRYWLKEVRELSYDIDDFLDELAQADDTVPKSLRRNKTRITILGKGRRRRRWIAYNISRFMACLKGAIAHWRSISYNLEPRRSSSQLPPPPPPPPPPTTTTTTSSSSSSSNYRVEAPRLIGIDTRIDKVGKLLTHEAERQLKVVSIVGLGGVGKTTLAKQLYGKLGPQFHCRAFVRSSQKPDIKAILTSILLQVRPNQPPVALESFNLVSTIRAHLQRKKYFIIIDDLCVSSTWDIVHHAFPDDNICSRILTTTELDTIAQRCCDHNPKHIFKLEPLSDNESRDLFLSMVTSNNSDCHEKLMDLSYDVVRRCGGFPLATIATASLLARQPDRIDKWNSLAPILKTNPTADGMKQVLRFCYNNLADHLKACMLYLSIHQEGHIIKKNDVVKQWVAEGFICQKQGEDMVEVAGTSFDELVNMRMIQPVDIKYNDQVLSFTVHGMVLDLIRSKSTEENFVTAIDHSETNISFADKVRRLSLDFGHAEGAERPARLKLSQVRSLVFFGLYKCLISTEEFRFLRVLILHLWSEQDHISLDLTTACRSFRLRYLEIASNVRLNIKWSLHVLNHLETLKIDSETLQIDSVTSKGPPDIVHLSGLCHLTVPSDTNLPNGIGCMTSLQTLGCFDLGRNSKENVLSLERLTNLRDLRLTCPTPPYDDSFQQTMECVASVLSKLKNLKSLILLPAAGSSNANTLTISSATNDPTHALVSMYPPALLESLELSPRIFIFPTLPIWIGELGKLFDLKIAVNEFLRNHVDILGKIPALAALSLYVKTAPEERIIFHKDRFPVLKYLKFVCAAPLVEFEEGAMPAVRRMKLGFSASTIKQDSLLHAGFKHLTGLEEISAKIGDVKADEYRRKAAQSELEAAFSPRKINIQWVDSMFYGRQILPNTYVMTNEGSDAQREIASREDTNTRIDSRRITASSSAPSSQRQHAGEKRWMWVRSVDGGLLLTRHMMRYMTRQLVMLKGFHVKTELSSINQEWEQMTIKIKEMQNNVLQERWILELQNLAYDTEDFIDIQNRLRFMSSQERNKLMRIRWWARTLAHMNHIVPLKHRLSILHHWQQSSHGGGTAAASSAPSAGFISSHPYVPRDELVGLDQPIKEILELLLPVSDEQEDQQRVISIVGFHGIGKTALAGAVYHDPEVRRKFNHRAWIAATEYNTAQDMLNMINQQVQDDHPSATTTFQYLLMKLQCILSASRCLIIIDDLQQKQMWYGIRDALAETLPYSRIIVTTSTQSIAAACSPERYIYKMRGLGISESRELLWRELRNRAGPTPALERALKELLTRCDGLPLALVSVAKYVGEKGETSNLLELGPGAFDELDRVLMQCYDSLRGHDHRSCLLYLSIFPKGHCIRRKSLMRRWLAEGLVSGDFTRSAEHVARDHFGELVDKNLIEPVLIGSNSVVKSCRVPDVMLDFLVKKAASKDMVTLIREDEPLHNKEGAHPVRRLSVHGSNTESGKIAEAIRLNHVRSLTIRNGGLFEFQGCQFLRVLDLEGCWGIDDWTLHCICKLILLKYLSFRGSDVCRIPKKIKNLWCLETLDIRETKVNKLPMEVLLLPNLAYLFGQFELPRELEDKKKRSNVEAFFSNKSVLRTISGFVMDRNGGSELILLHLRFLEKVKIWCNHSISFDSEDLAYSLGMSISKHNGLKSLSINFGDQSINFLDSVLLEGPGMLSSLKLQGRLSRLPNFITLLPLYELQLSNTILSLEDLSGLQQLRQLVYLKLVEGPHAFWGGRFVVKEDGFPSLQRLCFNAPKLPEVHIHGGGMSAVTSLHLLCPESASVSKFCGIEHLKHLNEVVLHSSIGDDEFDEWKKVARGRENGPTRVYKATST